VEDDRFGSLYLWRRARVRVKPVKFPLPEEDGYSNPLSLWERARVRV
jgi:hypothetical protein